MDDKPKPRRKFEPNEKDPGSTEPSAKKGDYEMIQSTNTNGANSEKTSTKNITRKNKPFVGREVNLRFFIGDQHTSPNKKGIVQINKGPKAINGVNDIGGIYEMVKDQTNDVEEYLSTQKKGILEPPEHSTHEELIKFRFRDRPVREDKDKVRNAVLCENPDGPDFAANDRLNRQDQGQGQGQGFNQGQGQGFNQGQGQGFNQGQGRGFNQGQGQGYNQAQGYRAPVTGFGSGNGRYGSAKGLADGMYNGLGSMGKFGFTSKSTSTDKTDKTDSLPGSKITNPNLLIDQDVISQHVIEQVKIALKERDAFKSVSPEIMQKNIEMLKSAYKKRQFFVMLFLALHSLYSDYIIPKSSNKMPLFHDEISILHKNLTKTKDDLLELLGKANNGKCEITNPEPETNTVTTEAKSEYQAGGEALDKNIKKEIINELNAAVGPNNTEVTEFKYGDVIFTREFIEKNKNPDIPDSEKYFYKTTDQNFNTKCPVEWVENTDNFKYTFNNIPRNLEMFFNVKEVPFNSTRLFLTNSFLKRNYFGSYINDEDTFLDKIYDSNMEKIIQNQWIVFLYDDDRTPAFYFNPVLRVLGERCGTILRNGKPLANLLLSVANLGISAAQMVGSTSEKWSEMKGEINPYTQWIKFIDPIKGGMRYFCPIKKIYGNLGNNNDSKWKTSKVLTLRGKFIEFYNEILDTIDYFSIEPPDAKALWKEHIPNDKPPYVDRFFEFFAKDIPMGILRSFPWIKNGLTTYFKNGLKNKFSKTLEDRHVTLTSEETIVKNKDRLYTKEICYSDINHFKEVKDFLKKTPANAIGDINSINTIFNEKAITITMRNPSPGEILTETAYFSKVVLFLEKYTSLLKQRMDNHKESDDIKKEERRIMDLGFFIIRKAAMGKEVDELLHLAASIAGSPLKYILFKLGQKTRNFFRSTKLNETKKIASGEILGGSRKNITRKLRGGGFFTETEHKPSFMSWNVLSGILRSVDCDIKDKYVYLSYLNNLLEAFTDNIFSDIVLKEGEMTTKTKLTNCMRMPYRFFVKNKIIGTIFIAYAIIGTLVTAASLFFPIITPHMVEAFHLGGKILKVTMTPFVDEPKQVALHANDILKINNNLSHSVDKEILKNMLYRTSKYDDFFMKTEFSLYFKMIGEDEKSTTK